MSQITGVGEIHREGAYTIREFCRRTGLSTDRIRHYVPVRRLANRSFVLGADFVEYLQQQPKLMPAPRRAYPGMNPQGTAEPPQGPSDLSEQQG